MPYKKKYKKRYRKKKLNVKALINKQIKAYMADEVEIKTNDVYYSGTISNSNIAQVMPIPIKGDNSYDRTGDRINVTSFYLRFGFSNGGDPFNRLRLMVFKDRLNRGTAFSATGADLLQNVSTSEYAMVSPLYKPSAGRYKIILDKLFVTTPSSNTVAIEKKYYFKFKKSKPIEFGTNTGTVTDIRESAYYFFFIGDSSAVPHPTLTYFIRMNYTDC